MSKVYILNGIISVQTNTKAEAKKCRNVQKKRANKNKNNNERKDNREKTTLSRSLKEGKCRKQKKGREREGKTGEDLEEKMTKRSHR